MPSSTPADQDPSQESDELGSFIADSLLIGEIPVLRWMELLTRTGWPTGLPQQDLTSSMIETWYRTGAANREVRDAVGLAGELRSPEARDQVLEQAQVMGLDFSTWPINSTPPDLAIFLWLSQEVDGVRTLIHQLRMLLHDDTTRAYREFHGELNERLDDPHAFIEPLRAACQQWCVANGRGSHVEVYGRTHGDDLRFEVIIPSPVRSHSEIDDHGRSVRIFRVAGSTFLRYDNATGKIGIAASGKMVEMYRAIFGRVLFGDENHFPADEATCSLDVLRKGAAILRRRPGDLVRDARLISCTATSGSDDRWTTKSSDCFRAFERTNLQPSELQFQEVKLRLAILGSGRSKTVRVTPPNILHGCDGEQQSIVLQFLEEIGIIHRGRRSQVQDLWDIHDHVLSEAQWRAIYGHSVTRLKEQRVLINAARRIVESPQHPAHGPVLEVQDLEQRPLIGISSHPDVPSAVLNDTNVDGLRFDVLRLAQTIGESLGMAGTPTFICNQTGIDLGDLMVGSQTIRVIVVPRPPGDEALLLRLAATLNPRARPLFLCPERRQPAVLSPALSCDIPAGISDALLIKIAEALGIAEELPAAQAAPRARLTVVGRGQARRIRWEGRETNLEPGTIPFKFIDLLARNPNRFVSHQEVAAEVSPHRSDPMEASRRAKLEAIKALKAWLEEQGRLEEFPEDAIATNSGYRFEFPCFSENNR